MIDDWSKATVHIRPLIVELEQVLNERRIEEAQNIAMKMDKLLDELINWCYRQGR